jgi:arsenate reductase
MFDMKLKIYHNPKCSKSREALGVLNNENVSLEIVEYLKDSPSSEELTSIIHLLGISAFELIRTTEDDFKTHFKGKQLTNDEWIKAMVLYPKLIQRPIIVSETMAVIGRTPESVRSIV